MARPPPQRRALVLASALALVACRGFLGIDPDREVDEGSDATTADAADSAPTTDGAPATDASADQATDADAAVEAASVEWANWPTAPDSPPDSQFKVTADTVTDTLTGLVWQRGHSASMPWDTATGYCKTVTAGGASDWRMPTWIELASLVDYTRNAPAMSGVFDVGSGVIYWSATHWIGTVAADAQVVVSFHDASIGPLLRTATHPPVRCVRGVPYAYDAQPGAPPGRYVLTAGTARDTKTKLLWQRGSSPTTLSFADAESYCASLAVDTWTTGWRLPRVRELLTILDPDATTPPHWDTQTFGATGHEELWAQTVEVTNPDIRWGVTTTDFGSRRNAISAKIGARCVHD